MPIRRGSVSLARFRVEGTFPKDLRRWVTGALKKGAFEAIDPKGDEERAVGFCELENVNRDEFAPGDVFFGMHALFAWRVDKLRVPGIAVRQEMLKWSQAFEQKNGRPPGRREKGDQKDVVRRTLRAKQEPVTKHFDISFDLTAKELFVWATSRAVIEEVQAALESNLEIKLISRVPAAFVSASALDAMTPTAALFGEV